ncbi:MAG: hypothetical protein LBT21_04255 [Oscillospiraceae bacterium]|jgi:hypothetical protein|nr:hypothetical protein [Oscillospiraceae bacterium]
MKSLKKALCLFFAVLFVIGSLGAAGASAAGDSIEYGIRRTSPGEAIFENSVTVYGVFKFEAVVPVESAIATYTWTITDLDTGVSAAIPGGIRIEERNKLTVNLNYGSYYIGFRYLNATTQLEIVYAPVLFVIAEPADKTALKALYEKNAAWKFEGEYTAETWEVFKLVRDAAKDLIANYDATQLQVDDMTVALQVAIDQLVKVAGAEKGSIASFFMLIMEIIQYVMFISRDRDLSEIMADLRNSIFKI